jgi:alanine racemase
MNYVMADVGPATTVREGYEAVLLGTQGAQAIWADEIAQQCGTIPYEILTGIRTDERRFDASLCGP